MTKTFAKAPALSAAVFAIALSASAAGAQTADPFAGGWTLDPEASALRFQSVKNRTKVEQSSFATVSGGIDESGTARIEVALDSVDTKVDLRNVRMRFLFFETFQFPKAEITAEIDPALLDGLLEARRKIIDLPYRMDLHGVTHEDVAEVAVTLLDQNHVAVATSAPISVAVSDYGLENGIRKLEEAAGVEIVPSATVSFDFTFARNAAAPGAAPTAEVAPTPEPDVIPVAAASETALEPTGAFDRDACVGRFEILSRTDNITFRSGSAQLDSSSDFLLDSIADIVNRCPGLTIEVGGHTDSDGGAAANRRLSDRRAGAVTEYLTGAGVPADRVHAVGYGEAHPVVPNDSAEHKRRNRRIEFKVVDG